MSWEEAQEKIGTAKYTAQDIEDKNKGSVQNEVKNE